MQITSYLVAFALILMGCDWVLRWLGVISSPAVGASQWGVFGGLMIIGGLMLMLGTGRRFNL
jgi:TRAP-type mannitol/chloroaromatic compound transport system permease small subunit